MVRFAFAETMSAMADSRSASPSPVSVERMKTPSSAGYALRSDLLTTLRSPAPASEKSTFSSAARRWILRSAASARSRARRMPSASMASPASRSPAVSAIQTIWPPIFKRTSTTSRVVPGISDTIAASRRASLLRSDDFPALGGPTIAIRNPSRIRSPTSSSCKASMSACRIESNTFVTGDVVSSGASSSSGKSMLTSRRASASTSFSRHLAYWAESAPSSWFRASDFCARVSASMRSATPSASTRSSRPFSKARRVNSPGSARRVSGNSQIASSA